MSLTQTPSVPVTVEFLPGERPAVRSVELAEHFGVKHCHVMRDIKSLMSKLPESFNRSNFGLVAYRDEKEEERPCFLLTRDAFTLLVMGWNSARAMEWKLRYIEAFNTLERAALENTRMAALAEGARAALAMPADRLDRIARTVAYHQKGLTCHEIAKLLDINKDTAWKYLRQARRLGLVAPTPPAGRNACRKAPLCQAATCPQERGA